MRVERNQLVVDPNGGLRSRGTGRFEVIDAGLVLRSIGYRTVPIEGVPFEPATSTLNNLAGQVVHPSTGEVARGEYVCCAAAGSTTPPTGTGGCSTTTSWPPAPPRAAPGSRSPRSKRCWR